MEDTNDFIPALGYNPLTHLYDKVIRWTMPETRFRDMLMDLLNPEPEDRILEFGYGTGQNIVNAISKEPNAIYLGLDIDPTVRALAIEKLTSLSIQDKVQLDLYKGTIFPYADNSFDKVYSCLVFHQLSTLKKEAALKEMYRVLKPEGILLVCDWGIPSNIFCGIGFYLVQMLDGFTTTEDNRQGMIPAYIEGAGFEQIDMIESMNTKFGTLDYTIGIKQITININ